MGGAVFVRAGWLVVHLVAGGGCGVSAFGEQLFQHHLVDETLVVQCGEFEPVA
ncbi:hypothetical protein [Actinopolyspora mzabensis]|uniref:hypothetical protein n=1 Tax=Actinopolyspora mzabensis TaxID=995066 RepID=UPI0015A31D8A|nr:hypothetical protein [Actinopolyspora mzabensis]